MRNGLVLLTLSLTLIVGCGTNPTGPKKGAAPPKLVSPDSFSDLKVRLQEHQSPVLAVAFSADGRLLASVDADQSVRLWDVASAKSVAEFAGGPDNVEEVAFLNNGRLLAVLFHFKLRIWDVEKHEELDLPVPAKIARMAASPATSQLAFQTFESKPDILLWDAKQRTMTSKLIAEGVYGLSRHLEFSPDGKYLAADYDRATDFIVWDTFAKKTVSIFTNSPYDPPFAFVPDRNLLAFFTGGSARLYEFDNDQKKLVLNIDTRAYSKRRSMAFSPDGNILAIGFNSDTPQMDRDVRLFDTRAKGAISNLIAQLEGHEQGVNAVAFSPTGEFLASASQDGTVILWSKKQGQ